MTETAIIAHREGVAGLIRLNRPKALNALDLPMLKEMRRILMEWHADPSIQAVILTGEGRSFCAGGDIKAVSVSRDDPDFLDQVYRVEYEVDDLLHRFGRPVVALVHGITMGGGCGISLHASHPVAAEDLVLAMPETAIGFFPDIAGSVFLSRGPDDFGLYMALTGARVNAADALSLGFVKAVVPREQHEALVADIAAGGNVDAVIAARAVTPDGAAALANWAEYAPLFAGDSARDIVARLEQDGSLWAKETLAKLRQQAPFSLELTIRAYRRAKGQSVRDVLASDFRVAQRLTMRNDYVEGVRARLIERGSIPVWSPASLEDVDLSEVENCFAPLSTRELWEGYDLR